MSVRYKFKNDLAFTTLHIDGFDISVIDLKKAIHQAKKMGRITDFDLIITNSETEEAYAKDEDLVPKNTSLIVAKHPLPQGQKKVWEEEKNASVTGTGNPSDSSLDHKNSSSNLFKISSLESSDLTEDDRISQMMANSTDMYNQKNWQHIKGRNAYAGQKVPPTYRCNKCQVPGHFIHDCPLLVRGLGPEVKRTTGIPRSFLEPCKPDTKGAKINPQGIHMVNKKEMEAFHETKNDRPDWERENTPLTKDAIEKNIQIPEDLKCQICQDLMKDAVMMPSCGCSMCDECARDALIKEENTKKECPICGEPDNSPDELIPVRKTREDVKKFRSAHMKEFAGAELNPVSALDNKNEQQKPLTLPDIPLPGISDVNLFKPEPETTSRSSPLHHYNKSPDAFYKSPVDNSNYDSLTPKYTPKDGETKVDSAKSTPRPTSTTPSRSPSRSPTTASRAAPTVSPTPRSPIEEKKNVDVSQPPPGYIPPMAAGLTMPPGMPPTSIGGLTLIPHAHLLPPGIAPPYIPGIPPAQADDPLAQFNRFLAKKDSRPLHHHRDYRPKYRSRSRSPPPYHHHHRGPPRGRYGRSPPHAYRRSKYSPPARYRDHSPPPRIERRAPPPLSPHHKGPRTPPSRGPSPSRRSLSPRRSKSPRRMSKSPPRRSKSKQPAEYTPPPGEEETFHTESSLAPIPEPPSAENPSTPLNDEKHNNPETAETETTTTTTSRLQRNTKSRSPANSVRSKDRTPSLSPEPEDRQSRTKQHLAGDHHDEHLRDRRDRDVRQSSREYEQTRYYDHRDPRSENRSSSYVKDSDRDRDRGGRYPPAPYRDSRIRDGDRGRSPPPDPRSRPRSRSRDRRSRSPYDHHRSSRRSRSPPPSYVRSDRRNSRSPYRGSGQHRSPPPMSSRGSKSRDLKYRDHRSPPRSRSPAPSASKSRYSNLDDWKAKDDYDRRNNSQDSSKEDKIKEKKKKEKKKKRRRSDSNSAPDNNGSDVDQQQHTKKKSKKVKKSKKIKDENLQEKSTNSDDAKESKNNDENADFSNSPKKLGESSDNLTEKKSKIPPITTKASSLEASNTPTSSEILKQNIKEPAAELNTTNKSKRIEIKLTTTEFKKQSEPESKKQQPVASEKSPLQTEKFVKLPEKLLVEGADFDDTLEINYKPEKSKWETDEEADQQDHGGDSNKKSLQNHSKNTKKAEQQQSNIDVDNDKNKSSGDNNESSAEENSRKKSKKVKKRHQSTDTDDEYGSKKSKKKSKKNSKDKDEKKLKKKEKKKEAEKMLMKIMMENPSMLKEMAEKLQTTGTGSGTTGNASKSRSSRSPSSPSKSADHSSSSRKYKSPTRNVIAHGDSIKVNLGRNSSPSVSRSSASRKVISSESSSNRKVIPQTSSTTGDSKNRRTRSRSRSNSRDHESSKRSIKDRLGPLNQEKSSSSFKQDHWNGKSKSGKSERNGRDSKRDSDRSNRDRKESTKNADERKRTNKRS